MADCKNCGKVLPEDWRYCPNCGQDQWGPASPPQEERTETPPSNVPPPPTPPPRESPAWLRGMGYTFGSCLLIAAVVIIVFIILSVVFVSCLAVVSQNAGTP
jgi:hypothetical protein